MGGRLTGWWGGRQAFEVFVNKDIGTCSTAELLSTFCDNIMKTGGDKIEGEIDTLLDKIVMLFSYLSDKVSRGSLPCLLVPVAVRVPFGRLRQSVRAPSALCVCLFVRRRGSAWQ